MARTFTPITGSGPSGAYADGDRWGYQTAEKARQGLDVANYVGDHASLGGHASVGYVTGAATWEAVDETATFTLNGDNLGGLALEAVVFYKTEDTSQDVQVRIRNVSDSTNAALSATSNSLSFVQETLTLTLASGVKTYRLEVLGGATYAVFAGGYIRLRKVPA